MNIISLENVSKTYGIAPLFENLTIGLEDRDKIGIIGANGSGKTTLLRLIAGMEESDSGRFVRAKGKSLAYLSQNPAYDENATVLETIFAASGGVMKLIADYEAVCHDLSLTAETQTSGRVPPADPKLLERMSDLQHELEISGGWDIETNARNVLTRLGIDDTGAKMGQLSGGQRKRVALAHELIFKPDILILDEPTNHLDADTIEWLEDYLSRYTGVLLLVTHDRYFLDRVTNRIFEIDRGAVQSFAGNYAYYLEKKDEQETLRAVESHKREQLIKKELAWLRRGAKARTRKSKHRIEAAYDLMAQPKDKAKAEVDIALGSSRLGKRIIELDAVSKAYGDLNLLQDFSYLVKRDDRIGIIGPNGSGKTTLLEIITGRVAPDSGEVAVGQTVVIGYYDQESRALDDDMRVIDYIKEIAEYVTTIDGSKITASQMLEKFLFPPVMQYAVVGNLSGGERRRLYLLRILMASPNVLLLDEPTNDLDIPTLIALEEYLDDFAGALIVVSHDRYFLDRTIDQVFRFEGEGRVREYPGDYSAYLEFREREASAASKAATASAAASKSAAAATPKPAATEPATAPAAAPKKLTFKEKQELEKLEKRIAAAETRLPVIDQELVQFGSRAGKVHDLFLEQQTVHAQLDADLARWAELAERV
ncbi:MAG: ABC-F family ATP-binding cassette domain-containing protein [Pyrinomonadaceae bacterium]